MIRSLYVAKTGLEAEQTRMDVIANNLANVNTSGFKGSRAVFQDLLYQNLTQPGAQSSQSTQYPSGLQLGTGVRPVSTERLMTQGNLTQTGNSLDVAINGQGFFQVLEPNGTIAYTRDGTFQLNNQGQLVTANGYLVQPTVTIPASAQSVTIGNDGTVSVTLPGQAAPQQVGALQLASFVNPTGLQSIGDNLYLQTGSSGAPNTGQPTLNGLGSVRQGYLESSNVNVVAELVDMISTQRAYEVNSKAVTASDQMLQYVNNNL
ncbi:MAG: flagellar basal-body rod protein FlgG [Thiomonas sp.]|jgi:flagellar basal-body rod protein FlgG|uniref:Flagellar basal-body rod protein FlgF n=1 Tax=Thiomonas arsenitoxydans (strain DSM 22701 / CIP 110005 / 3As) TaxID=426114 RepID=D6CQC4_THIA3|nr:MULTISPECIES: flagellar basal-body rod protein FlgG [Thiomonas]MDE2267921.1 flagellar basal-body rod protein FlgG [Betaproteobacteria bacterium]OYV29754.1 MAG: flagellar basal body rod protein FlgG [Thiomonas sp. 20-64-9]CQR41864.1 flagellar component of cell-distal portion of basal-body rod [Thiomonas sp. CB3]MBN8745220.1 flagellar basal-body rod protein FlgG [Thiomonas arsenitoxydans]MBN8775548.1 flagellar basal-body rod protein FlgG [Thiomonas arsenitoxydans]